MQIAAIDGTRLTILMIAGGLFSVAGILLMFRAKQEGSPARLELFGQKFEAASTGIIVFLIGAAFLAAPMYVPERPRANAPRPAAQATSAKEPVTSARAADPSGLLPPPVDKDEAEDNNTISAATILGIGETVRGAAKMGDVDWYAVAVDQNVGRELRVVLRRMGGYCPHFTILDGTEKVVKEMDACELSTATYVQIASDRYFVQVDPQYRDVSYELALTYKQ